MPSAEHIEAKDDGETKITMENRYAYGMLKIKLAIK